jgi:hypothetical protein
MGFGAQNRALVLLITETTAQLLLWQEQRLRELGVFGSSAGEQELFVDLLRLYPKHPVIIVTDLIDENFRHDTIVHVGGSDREALLKRKLDFAFRNTRYRIGIVTGRQSEGRRDDRVLFSALTKPERIDVWARRLLQERMAVQAVTSIAHLLNRWLPIARLEQEEYLLVSQLDRNNNLRQTFVHRGRVLFSRLASLTVVPERRLAMEILQECIQLRQYLERIQFLRYESHLRILVLSTLPADSIRLEHYSSELNQFETLDISALPESRNIELEHEALLPAHYLIAGVLQRRSIDNVYAPATLRRFEDKRSLGRLLLGSAAAVLLLGLGLNLPGLSAVFDKQEQAAAMSARALPLRRQYEELRSGFPATPLPPREMQLVVDTYRRIEGQLRQPFVALNRIAAALTGMQGLTLTSIDWALVEAETANATNNRGSTAAPRLQGLPADQTLTAALLQQRTDVRVQINGEAYSPQSFRAAQEQVASFISALEAADGIRVVARQMPIDVRPDVSVSATINDSEVRAPFSLELRLAAPTAQGGGQVAGAQP